MIIVLTDGHDVSSNASLGDAISAANRAKASVYAIGIAGRDFTPTALRTLATRTGGSYNEAASSSELGAIYVDRSHAFPHMGASLRDDCTTG